MLVAVDEVVVGVVGVVVVVVGVVVVVVGVVVLVVGVVVLVVVVVVVEVVVSGANKTRCYTDLSAHRSLGGTSQWNRCFKVVLIFHANFGQSIYNKVK